jgi:SAM-dependent methyltransferase
MPLLANCGFEIYGVEISEEIVSPARETLASLGIEATLTVGRNSAIPFAEGFFDYVLACHSCYYVDGGTSFNDNLGEIARVLKPNGIVIASLPAPGNFILEGCRPIGDGHVVITNDVFGLRNGYVFRAFESEDEVRHVFGDRFENVVVCSGRDDYWGLQINAFYAVGWNKGGPAGR